MNNPALSPAIFMGETKTRLVRGRRKFKVPMIYAPAAEEPSYMQYANEHREKELTELEVMYSEFCKKAHSYLIMHSSNQGEHMAHQIIFPDFIFQVVPTKFPVE